MSLQKLRRILLDLYNKNWKLIEDENYRVLNDAIFDHEIPKRGETRKHESWSEVEPEENEPPLKRTRLRSQTDWSSSSAGNHSPGRGKTSGRTPKEAYVSQTRCTEKIDVSPHLCLVDKKSESSPSEQFSSDRRTKHEHLLSPTHVRDGEEVPQFQFVQRGKKLKCERDTQCFSYKEPKGILDMDLSDEESVLDKHHNNAVIIKRERDADELPQFDVPLDIVPPAAPLSLAHEDGFTNGSSSNVRENDGEFLGTKQLNSEVVGANMIVLSSHINVHRYASFFYILNVWILTDAPLTGDFLCIVPPTLLLLCEDGSSNENCSDVERNGLELLEYKQLDTEDKGDDCASDSSQFEIASSPQGNVKISLICNSSRKSGFRIPSLDAVLKLVEEKYIKTYRITEPGFSVVKLMKDVCECFLAEGTNCTDDGQVRSTNLTSSLAISKKLSAQDVVCGRGYEGNFCIPPSFPNEPFRFRNFIEVLPQIPRDLTSTSSNVLNYITELNVNGNSYCGRDIKIKALEGLGPSNPSSLVVVQKHNSCLDPLKASHHIDDITRGAENAKISLVNEITDECLPEFHYIPRNIAYEHACVKFLLARVSDENCCSNCVGDCMSLIVPCACASETGGEFTYTHGRLVEEKFLEKCISLNCDPEQHRLFYCKDCPLERSKHKRVSGPCKGHLVRQFIKECWYKCGCSMKCGNRLVQQGITVNLQVFMTPEKGWGVRTLEDLPKGTFVCEYVGEIVTNTELFERNTQMSGREKHTYSVLLDADWGSKGVPRDEEALCLDATVYGNVARFINHSYFNAVSKYLCNVTWLCREHQSENNKNWPENAGFTLNLVILMHLSEKHEAHLAAAHEGSIIVECFDANLVEIPVEVETPDNHYYHPAFFTRRKVDALEELTWVSR
ncbi:unnamed protein product [Camellia sinensis]